MNKIEQDMLDKLSKDLKIRNKILNKLLFILYHKPVKFHNKTEEEIWNYILKLDKEFNYLK